MPNLLDAKGWHHAGNDQRNANRGIAQYGEIQYAGALAQVYLVHGYSEDPITALQLAAHELRQVESRNKGLGVHAKTRNLLKQQEKEAKSRDTEWLDGSQAVV